jgi:flagellar biosynthesis protein FlhB
MSEPNGTEAASPRRRQQARERGQVARSRELVFALVFGFVLVAGISAGPTVWQAGQRWLRSSLRETVSAEMLPADLLTLADRHLLQFAVVVLPLLGAVCLTIVLGHWLQHGPLWLPERMAPDVARLSPGTNLSRLGPAVGAGKGVLSLVKLAVLVGIAWHWSRANFYLIQGLMLVPIKQLAPQLGTLFLRFGCWLGLGLVIVAALDFAWQLWRHERELRMTPDERREEIRAVQNDVSHLRKRS